MTLQLNTLKPAKGAKQSTNARWPWHWLRYG